MHYDGKQKRPRDERGLFVCFGLSLSFRLRLSLIFELEHLAGIRRRTAIQARDRP